MGEEDYDDYSKELNHYRRSKEGRGRGIWVEGEKVKPSFPPFGASAAQGLCQADDGAGLSMAGLQNRLDWSCYRHGPWPRPWLQGTRQGDEPWTRSSWQIRPRQSGGAQ